MKRLRTREIKIGAAVLLALAALFFGINFLKGVNIFKASNYYYVSYTNVTGLAQSAPVTINGYKVGLVRTVEYEYDNPGHVRVEMSLDRKLQLPEGTKAALVTDLLGTASIELVMGGGPGLIPVGHSVEGLQKAGLMDAVGGELMPTVMTIAPHLDSLIVSLTKVAADPALIAAIQRLDAITRHLEGTTSKLDKSMTQLPSIVSNAGSAMANINELSANLATVSKTLAEVSADLKEMELKNTMVNINRITANLDSATAQLNSTNSSLGLLLNDPGLYNNINNSAAHLDSILIDLKRQPKRYIPPIKVF
ncbi:MAG: MlaD family protein [Duncaniella sp.]|nr:MlaD family protein [Duncaniella sp.]MDE5735350.1 MlaD family protein [Duncaniella sp.]MDE6390769.1 MlaD family protein [Duncaniella sp.]